MSETESELDAEFIQTRRRLNCCTFCCCACYGLIGLKHLKKAQEYKDKGHGVEARNELLKAKHKIYWGCVWGGGLCWGATLGIFVLLLLPFIWIPWLIITM